MKKILTASLAVATIAGSLTMTVPAANAGGGGVAAGVAAGLVGGAIIGGAIASSAPVYAGPPPAYVAGPPPGPGGCYWRRQRYWDGYGYVVRPVRVCY